MPHSIKRFSNEEAVTIFLTVVGSQNFLDDPRELLDSTVASTKTELVLRGNPPGFHNPYNPDSNQSLKHLRNWREETDQPVGGGLPFRLARLVACEHTFADLSPLIPCSSALPISQMLMQSPGCHQEHLVRSRTCRWHTRHLQMFPSLTSRVGWRLTAACHSCTNSKAESQVHFPVVLRLPHHAYLRETNEIELQTFSFRVLFLLADFYRYTKNNLPMPSIKISAENALAFPIEHGFTK